MGRPTKPIVLNDEERVKLQQWARRPKTAQRLSMRARIVLSCADGMENHQVARQLRITDQTVCKWRERFRIGGLDGLADEPRPGTPRRISDAQVEALITRTLESAPAQGTHWSTRTMAEATRMSQSAISRIWRAFGLQPHRVETFKLSSDPFFVEKVRDIVGLYLQLFFLPPYSPELNPDEQVWAAAKGIGRRVIASSSQMFSTLLGLLRILQRRPKKIRSFFAHPETCYTLADA